MATKLIVMLPFDEAKKHSYRYTAEDRQTSAIQSIYIKKEAIDALEKSCNCEAANIRITVEILPEA